MSPTDGVATRRLIGIDMLRGVAALGVLVTHIPHEAPPSGGMHPCFPLAMLAEFGYLGVPLFVVISGFCIHRKAAFQRQFEGRATLRWTDFWRRRIFRLYPPYVAAMAFSVAMATFAHTRQPAVWTHWTWDWLLHGLMLHNLFDYFRGGMGNQVFWSLGMEEQLYLLYFPLAAIMVRFGPWKAIWLTAAVTTIWRASIAWFPATAVFPHPFELGAWYFWPMQFWLHWTLGAVAVDAYAKNVRLPRWCRSLRMAALCAGAGFVLNQLTLDLVRRKLSLEFLLGAIRIEETSWGMTAHYLGEIGFAIAFFQLINWCVANEHSKVFSTPLAAALASVGRVSYSLYLTHAPLIFWLEDVVPLGSSPRDWLLRFAIQVPICVAFGYLFFHCVERWFIDSRNSGSMASWKEQLGCWLNERWRGEFVLRFPRLAGWCGLNWLDLTNRSDRLAVDSLTGGRICRWEDSSRSTLCRTFPFVGGRLLRHVLQTWPVELASSNRSLRSMQESFDATVILPVGGIGRLSQFKASLASVLAQRDVNLEVIVAEQSDAPRYRDHIPAGVKHVHLAVESAATPFNKSWTMNVAARHAQGDVLILLDADMLLPRDAAATIVRIMNSRALDSWRFARGIFNLTEADSARMHDSSSLSRIESLESQVANTPMPVAVRRDRYGKLGGHDETFVGWGGEDVEFVSRLRTGRHSDGGLIPIIHIWHPAAPQKAPGLRNNELQAARLAIPPVDRISELTRRDWGQLPAAPVPSEPAAALGAIART